MSEPEHGGISQDTVYEILSNPRRRFALSYLREVGEPVALTDLATAVAAWENDVDPAELTDQQEKRVYVSLYQTHVPKLEQVGVVEYHSDSGQVALAENVSQIERYVPTDTDDPFPWPQVYVAIAAVAAGLYVLAVLNAPIVGAVPQAVVGAVIAGLFLTVAVVHFAYARFVEPDDRLGLFRRRSS